MGKEKSALPDDYWPKQVASWKESGLSQSAYCRQAGINNKRFHYHMQRLRKDEGKPALRFIEAMVALNPAVEQKQESKLTMHLALPNGVEVILEEVSFDLLPQVLI
jgi:hypothetical protein